MRHVFALCLVVIMTGAAPATAQSPAGLPVPDEFKEVEPFVRFLEQHGLTVSEVASSDLSVMVGAKASAYVGTERGRFDIMIFRGQNDAERIRVTYSRGGRGSHHVYQIADLNGRQPPRTTEVDHPLYFTMHRNWFVVTPNAVLDEWLKAKLGQSVP
jgi:hypothetical protein